MQVKDAPVANRKAKMDCLMGFMVTSPSMKTLYHAIKDFAIEKKRGLELGVRGGASVAIW
jgi:hypothetical protein